VTTKSVSIIEIEDFKSKGHPPGSLILSIKDRDLAYFMDYKVFMIGVLVGIFSSVCTGIICEFLRDYEMANYEELF
jgi:hypothetical protein